MMHCAVDMSFQRQDNNFTDETYFDVDFQTDFTNSKISIIPVSKNVLCASLQLNLISVESV